MEGVGFWVAVFGELCVIPRNTEPAEIYRSSAFLNSGVRMAGALWQREYGARAWREPPTYTQVLSGKVLAPSSTTVQDRWTQGSRICNGTHLSCNI